MTENYEEWMKMATDNVCHLNTARESLLTALLWPH